MIAFGFRDLDNCPNSWLTSLCMCISLWYDMILHFVIAF